VSDVEHTATLIRDAIRDLPKRYEENANEIKNIEKQITDYLHYIELVDLNASEGFRAYKELQAIQKERRRLKDDNELLKHIYPALKSLRNNLSQFDKAIGGIRKTKRHLEKRTYRCRSAKNLQEKINEVKS